MKRQKKIKGLSKVSGGLTTTIEPGVIIGGNANFQETFTDVNTNKIDIARKERNKSVGIKI